MAESPKKNPNERVYRMAFGSVYPLYIQKAEKKGRTRNEVNEIITWLTGYDKEAIKTNIDNEMDSGANLILVGVSRLVFTTFTIVPPADSVNSRFITAIL